MINEKSQTNNGRVIRHVACVSCGAVDYSAQKMAHSAQKMGPKPGNTYKDQIDRDDIIQQPRHEQNQDPRDQCYRWLEQLYVQVDVHRFQSGFHLCERVRLARP